jgi:protein required for attachment to host cells
LSAKTPNEQHAWFAAVDAQRCRLLRLDRPKSAISGVEEVGVLDNSWRRQKRGLATSVGGPAGNCDPPPPGLVAEQLRRFMQEVMNWLNAECRARGINRLVVLAAPRALAQLRRSPDSPGGTFDFRPGNLMHFSTSVLAVHPVVRSLLGGETGDGGPSPCDSGEGEP